MDSPLVLRNAGLSRGGRTLWSGLDLEVDHGEFLAVLGPNGAGKTSLLKVLLGQLPLTTGTVLVDGAPPTRGNSVVGYLPQQRAFDVGLAVRARDLVALGADGHRFGLPWAHRSNRARVDDAIAAVGATDYASQPIGRLSGGEQQRIRVAQAMASDPSVLLCDEPLLSLDLNNQRGVVELIDARRRTAGTVVVMVTHEINPVLPLVDRVLYLVDGRCAVGTPAEVMTSACLSDLYDTQIDVLHHNGRIIVVGAADAILSELPTADAHHHHGSA